MKKALFIFFCLLNNIVFGQAIEIASGVNINRFYDFEDQSGHYHSNYTPGLGYSLRLSCSDIKIEWQTWRFSLGYDNYWGKLSATGGGQAGVYTTDAEIHKSILTLGVFPVNFSIKHKLDINLGCEIGKLIGESYSGKRYGSSIIEGDWSSSLGDRYDKFNSEVVFGFRGRIAYNIALSDKLSLNPEYSFYLGTSHEFIEFPKETMSYRHNILIGIKRKLE